MIVVTMFVVGMSVAVAMITLVVTMSVAPAAIVVVLVLAIMMAVVVTVFFPGFVTAELPFPSAMTSPVGVLAAYGISAVIAEARIIAAIDVAAKTDRTMEPGSSTEEDCRL